MYMLAGKKREKICMYARSQQANGRRREPKEKEEQAPDELRKVNVLLIHPQLPSTSVAATAPPRREEQEAGMA